MAIIFDIWAECADAQTTLSFLDHFAHLQHTLVTGRTITWQGYVEPSDTEQHSATIWSSDLSRSGVRSLQDVIETTEAGLRIYHHLLSAPNFRYARMGNSWTIPLADLPGYVQPLSNGKCLLNLDCVVDDALYQELGKPQFFVPFKPGYWWHRYRGETYSPLHSNDQDALNQLCRELFPTYFAR